MQKKLDSQNRQKHQRKKWDIRYIGVDINHSRIPSSMNHLTDIFKQSIVIVGDNVFSDQNYVATIDVYA